MNYISLELRIVKLMQRWMLNLMTPLTVEVGPSVFPTGYMLFIGVTGVEVG